MTYNQDAGKIPGAIRSLAKKAKKGKKKKR